LKTIKRYWNAFPGVLNMDYRQTTKDLFHLVVLVGLVLGLLYLLTWTGVLRCAAVPGWCDAYWLITRGGPPRVLIIDGGQGMGDPDLLRQALGDPQHAGVQAAMSRLDLVNLGNIKRYDLVIVERSRTMSTGKLKMFMEYVNSGGRLVWTGDAGTQIAPGDALLLESEDPDLNSTNPVPINPWRRKEYDRIVAFDQFLSVGYVARFCEVKACSQTRPWQGILRLDQERDHPLVYGLREGLVLRGDYAIVRPIDDVPSTRVLTLDWEGNLITQDNRNLGNSFPMIQTGGVGDRVVYYAVPPEQFVAPDLPEKYWTIVEQMYFGMIK